MDNKMKLQSLENELSATLKHAEDVMNAYTELALEQAVSEVLDEMMAGLTDKEKTLFLLSLIGELQSDTLNNLVEEDDEVEEDEQDDLQNLLTLIANLRFTIRT
jgi:hypothetical protein